MYTLMVIPTREDSRMIIEAVMGNTPSKTAELRKVLGKMINNTVNRFSLQRLEQQQGSFTRTESS